LKYREKAGVSVNSNAVFRVYDNPQAYNNGSLPSKPERNGQ